MKRIASLTLGLAVAMAMLGIAQAQIDSPPPPLMGQPSFHLYSVPWVRNQSGMGAFFYCTNTTSANIRVGVEIFHNSSTVPVNDASGTSLDLPPGHGRLFGSTSPVWATIASDIGGGGGFSASARILATKSSGIICSAFLADPDNVTPTFMMKLSVVKKTKQKGE